MKAIRILILNLTLVCLSLMAFSQERDNLPTLPNPSHIFVRTKPNATLYRLKHLYVLPAPYRDNYVTTQLKAQRIRKPTSFEVIDYTNINRIADYDAYVVAIKDKHYVISANDVEDNCFLEIRNNMLSLKHNALKDSADYYSSSMVETSYKRMVDLVDSRIWAYEDSVVSIKWNQEIDSRIKEKTEKHIQESLVNYRERREHYYSWVSTLPASVQKDAKIIAIPESEISMGYVGRCDYVMTFVNMSDKTIKYLTWSGRVKNAVNDYITCEVRHTSTFSGQYTGPCKPLYDEHVTWDTILYNRSADTMVLSSITITYMDGSSVTIKRPSLDYLSSIPQSVFFDRNHSYIGYEMASGYENGYDLEQEVENTRFIYGDNIRREVYDTHKKYRERANCYRELKRLIGEHEDNPWTLKNYLEKGSRFSAIRGDTEVVSAVRNYYYAASNYKQYSERLSAFEQKYFGFLNL